MKNKKIFLVIIVILSVWSFYGYLIRKISLLEKENVTIGKSIKELEKEKNDRLYEYDNLMDLGKIEKEMNSKKNMSISGEINFFRIRKDSLE